MCLKVENSQQAAYIIAAVYLVYYVLSALTSAITLITLSGTLWFSILVLIISLVSIPFQYFLFDGAKKSIPEKVEYWIKFSMFVSAPYLIIILVIRLLNLNLDAIITVLALAALLYCIRTIKYFHAELVGGAPPSAPTA
ncbi:uncharacterized protein LOC135936359 [Cloeon dipterum]|uniref:uncharacterized protein LOC135936359 n=1 Tax=Cloeon dipterum TaxID=197152 RepID=UPI00321FAEEF